LQGNLIEHFTLLDEPHENDLYLEGVEKNLKEWNSQEDEQAYADL
jgi:hypothetical protein